MLGVQDAVDGSRKPNKVWKWEEFRDQYGLGEAATIG
jgi:hypothetical protein